MRMQGAGQGRARARHPIRPRLRAAACCCCSLPLCGFLMMRFQQNHILCERSSQGRLDRSRLPMLSEKELRDHFNMPLNEVAKKYGMCTTALKKLCRKYGVMQVGSHAPNTANM